MAASFVRFSLAFAALILGRASAFSSIGGTTTTPTERSIGSLSISGDDDADAGGSSVEAFFDERSAEAIGFSSDDGGRRAVLKTAITVVGSAAAAPAAFFAVPPAALAAAEERRCDAVDPRCGADGILRDERPSGKPIPRVTNRITHVVQLVIDVGERREEVGALRFGLYGDDCPKTVRTMIEFLTPIGITGEVTEQKEDSLENGIGIQTSTVTILEGGVVPEICPGTGIEFGVPSQQKAYARTRGLQKAGSNFAPQNRPVSVSLESEPSARKHDVAGLVSVPEKGIGWSSGGSGSGGGDVDGAYASAFLVTTADDNSELLDGKLRRRVIGQVIDDESMRFLARLSSLPVQKKGPGGKGPPLLKVTVLDSGVQKVGASNQKSGKKKK
eukprot:CAMPEP_0197180636 /NCGR_PEP_ID=MMETSP1423-20130617/5179_1 /TAXON_ID=476441 /ORGANISM="Pseudo-nitzschia heimii, Strain UNC1101" /LENGTH=386 /DNA_ID=CAMNT_0042630743 /DNA_START=22 /DNA_END=1182 /DNA_ORIENTATION=-